jgi:hypothetical protein
LPQRVRIVSLGNPSNWTLLAFQDQEVFQSIRFYTALAALVAIVSYVLLLAGLSILACRLVQRPVSLASFWPRQSMGRLYIQFSGAYLLLGEATFLTILRLPPWEAVLLALLVPLVSLLWTLWVLTEKPAKPSPRPGTWILASICVLLLTWACAALVPEPRYGWRLLPLLLVPAVLEGAFRLRISPISSRSSLQLFSIALLALLLLVGGLPVWAVYRAAFQKEGILSSSLSQREMLHAIANRPKSSAKATRDFSFYPLGEPPHFEGTKPAALAQRTEMESLLDRVYASLRHLDNDYTLLTTSPLREGKTCDTDLRTVRCDDLSIALPGLLPSGMKKILWLTALLLATTGAFALVSLSVHKLFGIAGDENKKNENDKQTQELKDKAESDPEQIWLTLTSDEQQVCRQLAQGSHFRLGKAAEELRQRGLLTADPLPRLAHGAFQSFVRRRVAAYRGSSNSGKASQSRWISLRNAVVLGLVVFLILLFLTQGESFKTLSAAISGVGIALAGLWQIGAYLLPPKSGNSSTSADRG